MNEDNLTTADIIDEDNEDDKFFTLGEFNRAIENMGGGAGSKQAGEKKHQLEAASFPAGQRNWTPLGCWQRRLKTLSVTTIRIEKHTWTCNEVSNVNRVIC